jgi:ketosteroid isomerase-like protein
MTPDEEELLAANMAFYTAFNTKDIRLMEGTWADHPAVACVHPGWMMLTGREPVLASWRAILGNDSQGRILPGAATAHVIGDCGIVYCRELAGGAGIVTTNIFVRQDGRWRLLQHHASGVYAGS